MGERAGYVLGSDEAEIARLDAQAASIAGPTELLLRAAGLRPGMRVLDLGTGLGDVAFAVAELVGPEGAVVGIDQAEALLAVADARRVARGAGQVRFELADVHDFRDPERFDAVVTRLLLFHLPDAEAVVRRHAAALHPDGVFAALDFDLGTARSEPAVPVAQAALGWAQAAFRSAGADPVIGSHLALLLRDAGLRNVGGFGVVRYFGPTDPAGPALLSGVVRALAPQILAAGIASAEELALDTLQDRIARDVAAARAVVVPPAVAGAWGRA
ncbi:MAG: methyltransferase domain-containing protein [Solirubrobacteraceae bacterium]